MKTPTPQHRLAPAPRNSVAPVHLDRSARSRRNCTASPPLISRGAARHIESLSAVALPDLGEKDAGEKWRWVSKPKAICALADGKRAPKER